MARIASLNMLLTDTGKDFLAELYGDVIENVQKGTISNILKNTNLSGSPTSGTVEAKRFVNSTSKAYGTARAANKGDAVKVEPVTVAVNTHREIVEEVEDADTVMYGVDGLLTRRSADHARSMTRELERAFFSAAVTAGTAITTTETKAELILEAAIQQIENTKNDFVDGVPRDMIAFVCSTEFYGQIRNFLDTTQNSNVDTATGEFGRYHGVPVYSSVYLPAKTNFVGMVEGSVAQPVRPKPYGAEKIQLSNAYGIALFYDYGTKVVMPDLIVKSVTP